VGFFFGVRASTVSIAAALIYYFRKSSHGATNFLHVTVLS
jgi:hypothetical protein